MRGAGRGMSARALFTVEEREALRAALIAAAESDERIRAAAHTGSFAVSRHDRWSDIDLALSVADESQKTDVVEDWTTRMYRDHRALVHHDIWRGATLFRVFMLANTLQVDLAFWSSAEFGAVGPAFRLAFGAANERVVPPSIAPHELIGMAWLYALHVRSSLVRRRIWQAEYMLSEMRNNVIALACSHHGLSVRDARGVDDLPPDVTCRLERTLATSFDLPEIKRAFAEATALLLDLIPRVDADLSRRLNEPLNTLVRHCDV